MGDRMRNEQEYIYMVYQKGSFSKAAQALYLTQPALSIAIQKVESEIGMPLFDRSQKPLALTEAGRIYIEALEEMKLLENRLQSQLLDLTSMNVGNVRIGATSYLLSCILPPVLLRFKKQYPGITLDIVEAGSYELRELLKDQKLDMMFLSRIEEHPFFEGRPAFQDRIIVAVPANLPVNKRIKEFAMTGTDIQMGRPWREDQPCIDLKVLKEVPFILLESKYELRRRSDRFFEECGIQPEVCMEVSQIVTAYTLAQARVGATFIPDRAVTGNCEDLLFYKLDSPYSDRNMQIATNKKSYISSPVKRFIEVLVEYYSRR